MVREDLGLIPDSPGIEAPAHRSELDRLFLDANVPLSAAYRKDAGARSLWSSPQTELLTPASAVEGARRNPSTAERRASLDKLLEDLRMSNLLLGTAGDPEIEASGLPEKICRSCAP